MNFKTHTVSLILLFCSAFSNSLLGNSEKVNRQNWNTNCVLEDTQTKPAKTAVLIITDSVDRGYYFFSNRWSLGRKTWEQYMNSNPNVDCYFVKTSFLDPTRAADDQVWQEGNTLYVGDAAYIGMTGDRILNKTIAAMEWLRPHYTHFVRTNLNVFMNLEKVDEYMQTHSDSFYTTPVWEEQWYTIGYGIIFTADVAEHLVNEYRRLESMGDELISTDNADDAVLTALATGIWPFCNPHPFVCCPSLPAGKRQLMCEESLSSMRANPYGLRLSYPITFEEAVNLCESEDQKMLYRQWGGMSLNELARLYECLLKKNYPQLKSIDLVSYADELDKLELDRIERESKF